jgi:hypothetical protein
MKDEKKDKLFEEQLRKFKYRVDYKISETPRYRPLIGSNEQFDNLPTEVYNTEDGQPVPQTQSYTNEAGDQEDAPIPGGGAKPNAPSNDQAPPGMTAPPIGGAPGEPPAGPPAGNAPTPPEGETPPAGGGTIGGKPPVPPTDVVPPAPPEVGQEVDDIQNDIIKHNIAAMQSIDDQLKSLNATVQGLNAKLQTLDADVEEVREPTNTEKLINKKDVSYPYYFNLNDMWSGNWFNDRREAEHEEGVRELPDGTFIADFDDLPQKSKTDVQNSFNDFA